MSLTKFAITGIHIQAKAKEKLHQLFFYGKSPAKRPNRSSTKTEKQYYNFFKLPIIAVLLQIPKVWITVRSTADDERSK
jgi:hypothetical protein